MTSSERHRILIDATAARFGGTAYAIIHLARRLARSESVEAVFVIARERSIVLRGLASDDYVQLITLRAASRLELFRRVVWQATKLPGLVRRLEATVLLSPAGMLPTGVGVPVVSYLLNPVAFQDDATSNRLRRWAIARTSRTAASVLVPSEHQRSLVETAIGRQAGVVPLGIDQYRFRPRASPGEGILCVADFYRHKRHDLLLDAWQSLAEPRPALRLIGSRDVDESWAVSVERTVDALKADGAGMLSMQSGLSLGSLVDAYRSAGLFVMASERESFCMPLAEALSSGVPAVVRDLDVLRETGGPGCLYVGGDNPVDWAQAIARVLRDERMRADLRSAGVAHVKRYSFSKMTDGVLAHLPQPSAVGPRALRPWVAALMAGTALLLLLVLLSFVAARQINEPVPPRIVTKPAMLDPNTVYGSGVTTTVPAPVPSLRRTLSDTWHRIDPPVARISVLPSGRPARYFSVGAVVVGPRDSRLEAVTSRDEKALANVAKDPSVLMLGPFRSTGSARQALALYPIDARKPTSGPPLTISPIDARFRAPGEGLLRQRQLLVPDPLGRPSFEVPVGSSTAIRMTPGLSGPVTVHLAAATSRGRARVVLRIGGRRRSVTVTPTTTTVQAGPFQVADSVSFTVRSVQSDPKERLFVSDLRLVAVPRAAPAKAG